MHIWLTPLENTQDSWAVSSHSWVLLQASLRCFLRFVKHYSSLVPLSIPIACPSGSSWNAQEKYLRVDFSVRSFSTEPLTDNYRLCTWHNPSWRGHDFGERTLKVVTGSKWAVMVGPVPICVLIRKNWDRVVHELRRHCVKKHWEGGLQWAQRSLRESNPAISSWTWAPGCEKHLSSV